jgi:hypothetical protein
MRVPAEFAVILQTAPGGSSDRAGILGLVNFSSMLMIPLSGLKTREDP